MYMAFKHPHLLFVLLSVGLFFTRFVAQEMGARFVQGKLFKIAPHIVDTLLLASGISLIVIVGYPLFPLNWLSAKLILVIGYIILGVLALKAPSKAARWTSAILALVCILGIVHLALSKSF